MVAQYYTEQNEQSWSHTELGHPVHSGRGSRVGAPLYGVQTAWASSFRECARRRSQIARVVEGVAPSPPSSLSVRNEVRDEVKLVLIF